jgi:hypothetical protein
MGWPRRLLGRPLKELKKKYLTIILPKNKIRIID